MAYLQVCVVDLEMSSEAATESNSNIDGEERRVDTGSVADLEEDRMDVSLDEDS